MGTSLHTDSYGYHKGTGYMQKLTALSSAGEEGWGEGPETGAKGTCRF